MLIKVPQGRHAFLKDLMRTGGAEEEVVAHLHLTHQKWKMYLTKRGKETEDVHLGNGPTGRHLLAPGPPASG